MKNSVYFLLFCFDVFQTATSAIIPMDRKENIFQRGQYMCSNVVYIHKSEHCWQRELSLSERLYDKIEKSNKIHKAYAGDGVDTWRQL